MPSASEYANTQVDPSGQRRPVTELPERPKAVKSIGMVRDVATPNLSLDLLAVDPETPGGSYEMVDDLSTVAQLAAISSAYMVAVVTVEPGGKGVRWRGEGGLPTDTVGVPLAAGSTTTFTGSAEALAALRFIEFGDAVTPAVLHVTYFVA